MKSITSCILWMMILLLMVIFNGVMGAVDIKIGNYWMGGFSIFGAIVGIFGIVLLYKCAEEYEKLLVSNIDTIYKALALFLVSVEPELKEDIEKVNEVESDK